MDEAGLRAGLESRLKALASHIDELRTMMTRAKGARRIEDFAEIEELERRYIGLDQQLRRLGQEEPHLRQGVAAQIDAGASDLTRWVAEHVTWIESGFRPDRRPQRLSGS
jgi:hypothetical protein